MIDPFVLLRRTSSAPNQSDERQVWSRPNISPGHRMETRRRLSFERGSLLMSMPGIDPGDDHRRPIALRRSRTPAGIARPTAAEARHETVYRCLGRRGGGHAPGMPRARGAALPRALNAPREAAAPADKRGHSRLHRRNHRPPWQSTRSRARALDPKKTSCVRESDPSVCSSRNVAAEPPRRPLRHDEPDGGVDGEAFRRDAVPGPGETSASPNPDLKANNDEGGGNRHCRCARIRRRTAAPPPGGRDRNPGRQAGELIRRVQQSPTAEEQLLVAQCPTGEEHIGEQQDHRKGNTEQQRRMPGP